MCVKIIGSEKDAEFNPNFPLEQQIVGAKEIFISYDPLDPKIEFFMDQVEDLVKSGISCPTNIKFNANNNLTGIKLERRLERLKRDLSVNEIIKSLSSLHSNVDKKLCELSRMCLEKINE